MVVVVVVVVVVVAVVAAEREKRFASVLHAFWVGTVISPLSSSHLEARLLFDGDTDAFRALSTVRFGSAVCRPPRDLPSRRVVYLLTPPIQSTPYSCAAVQALRAFVCSCVRSLVRSHILGVQSDTSTEATHPTHAVLMRCVLALLAFVRLRGCIT